MAWYIFESRESGKNFLKDHGFRLDGMNIIPCELPENYPLTKRPSSLDGPCPVAYFLHGEIIPLFSTDPTVMKYQKKLFDSLDSLPKDSKDSVAVPALA